MEKARSCRPNMCTVDFHECTHTHAPDSGCRVQNTTNNRANRMWKNIRETKRKKKSTKENEKISIYKNSKLFDSLNVKFLVVCLSTQSKRNENDRKAKYKEKKKRNRQKRNNRRKEIKVIKKNNSNRRRRRRSLLSFFSLVYADRHWNGNFSIRS